MMVINDNSSVLAPTTSTMAWDKRGAILLLLGVLSLLEVELVGRLFLVEIVFAVIFVWCLLSKNARRDLPNLIRVAVPLIFIWLLAQVATDYYRSTPFEDYARGWAKISFFCADLVAIGVLTQSRPKNIILFVVGFCLSQIIVATFFFGGWGLWKFGYGMPLTTLFVIAATHMQKKSVKYLILAILIAVNLLFDFRSLAGFCLVATLAASYGDLHTSVHDARARLRRAILWFGFAALVSFFFIQLYLVSEELGYGSLVGQYERSGAARNPLYGRLEFVIGLQAAMDSPIVGHGSWAKDFQYAYLMNLLVRETKGDAGPIFDDLIPTHSYLISAWVEAGIVGAIFWTFILIRTLRAFKIPVMLNITHLPFVSFYLAWFVWAILFSPFGATERIYAATAIVLVSSMESIRLKVT